MRIFKPCFKLTATLLFAWVIFTGCESSEGGGAQVSGGVYYGVGFYDPWYHGDYHYDGDVIINPPDNPDRPDRPDRPSAPPRPEHPIARPPVAPRPTPRPMPSIPSAPRPMPRGGGGRR